jgi:DNA-binding response OmpR family regulator
MPTDPLQVLRVGALQIHRARHSVRIDGRDVAVTRTELALLWALARTPGEAVSRDALLDEVWGEDAEVGPRAVDIHIARLRRKLRAAARGSSAPIIETVWGIGYQLRSRGAE